jgi:hypothetical protein
MTFHRKLVTAENTFEVMITKFTTGKIWCKATITKPKMEWEESINKTNNHLEPQIIKHKKDWYMALEIQSWDRHTNVVGLNWLMRFQSSPSW